MPKFDTQDVDKVSDYGINVWELQQVNGQIQDKIGHPAIYPIELPERILRCYSTMNANVYEPFAGSGTTIVAAEQLNRICYAMELSPAYVAVCLERLTALGLEAKRID